MEYTNEAFIKMTLAFMPNTVFTNCVFEDCTIIVFDDSVQIADCRFKDNVVINVGRVL